MFVSSFWSICPSFLVSYLNARSSNERGTLLESILSTFRKPTQGERPSFHSLRCQYGEGTPQSRSHHHRFHQRQQIDIYRKDIPRSNEDDLRTTLTCKKHSHCLSGRIAGRHGRDVCDPVSHRGSRVEMPFTKRTLRTSRVTCCEARLTLCHSRISTRK